jgi:predicted NBD/HSP70 family sugar kinase
LISENLIEERGTQSDGKGRPFSMLGIKPENYAIGIDIKENTILGTLINFNGKITSSHKTKLPQGSERHHLINAIQEAYTSLSGRADGLIHGIGISIAGIIDIDEGVIVDSVTLPSLNGMNFRDEFDKIIDGKKFYTESSRAIALGEKWFGFGKDENDFIIIDHGEGIGAGLIFDRHLYTGSGKFAGEIGHITIKPEGNVCRCGKKGCLEAYVSEQTIVEDINKGCNTAFQDLSEIPEYSAQIAGILQPYIDLIGLGISTVLNILNATTVIVNSHLMKFKDKVLPELDKAIQKYTLKEIADNVRVAGSSHREAAAVGAASLVLSELFELEGVFYV